MKKKIIIGAAAVLAAACMTVTAFAGRLDSFMLGDSRVNCSLRYFDSTGGNPFDNDSVTAITESDTVMNQLIANPTLYYINGNQYETTDELICGLDVDYVEKTVSKYTGATGYKGTGWHEAFDGERVGSSNTIVTW